jgi:hypothetical protein
MGDHIFWKWEKDREDIKEEAYLEIQDTRLPELCYSNISQEKQENVDNWWVERKKYPIINHITDSPTLK